MALSNPEPNAVPLESEPRISVLPTSPVVSGFTTYGAMVPKVWTPPFPQQQCLTLPRQSLDFDVPQLQRASIIEGFKEATTHDFLSLYGGKNASLSEATVTRGLASSVTTQNLLQPLEKGSGLSSRGPVTVAGVTGQETGFALVNGTLDLPSNALYRVDRVDFGTGRRQEDVSEIPRQWAAGDTSQKLEAKSSDSKESTPKSTPRSKHSAMEQRRRTKINDRFQMLRQLVPNVDQKRDKASFLLEVIDYVKVLQEKVRKYEAAEQSRQQERLKPILWDVSQRNPGCRDSSADSAHILVPAVPLDTQKASDSTSHMSPLPATRENEVSGAELMSCLGPAVALSDRPAQGPQAPHSSSDSKVMISRTTTVPLTSQMSAVSVLESSSCMPHFVPRVPPEPQAMFDHVHYNDNQTAVSKGSAYKRVEGKSNEEFDSLKAGQVLQQNSKETGIAVRELEKDDGRVAPDVNSPKTEQKSKVQTDKQADEKDQIGVQGGVINVSSLYSKGLLDTLTRALQSSGLDLSKATISVQIDLGRPGAGNIAASSRRTSSQSTELCKESGSSPELEHPAKRSKVEVDV